LLAGLGLQDPESGSREEAGQLHPLRLIGVSDDDAG
jgi:hypothetical protein